MNLMLEKFEQTLGEMWLNGRIVVTFDVHEDAMWCLIVSTPNGLNHVRMDFDQNAGEVSFKRAIEQQLRVEGNHECCARHKI
jgi:hypothetical protein